MISRNDTGAGPDVEEEIDSEVQDARQEIVKIRCSNLKMSLPSGEQTSALGTSSNKSGDNSDPSSKA